VHQSSTKPTRSVAMDELEGAAICMGEKQDQEEQ
jgi:hypothetical protein